MAKSFRARSFVYSHGFGIVEVIFSCAILSVVALGALSIFRPVDKQVKAQRVKQTIRAIESAILSATEDPAILRNFRHDRPFKIPMGSAEVLTANALAPEFFDANGERCDRGTPGCVIKIEQLRFVGPNLIYKLNVENTGSVENSGQSFSSVVNAEPKALTVDVSLTPFANLNQESLSCPENFIPKGLGATGQFECWKVEVQNCPSNQIPKGLTFREDLARKTYFAKVECIEPRIFRCPAYHVFNQVNMKYMDPDLRMPTDLMTSGSCIFSASGAVDKINGACPKVAYAPMGGVSDLVEDPSNPTKCILSTGAKALLYEDPIQDEAEVTGEEVEITEEDSLEVQQGLIEGAHEVLAEEIKVNPSIATIDCERNPSAIECNFEGVP